MHLTCQDKRYLKLAATCYWFTKIFGMNTGKSLLNQEGARMPPYCWCLATHPNSSDRLCRSHIMQYSCAYCKSYYCWGYYEGTLTLLWQKAEKLMRMQKLQSILIVPSTVLLLAVATLVLHIWDPRSRSGGIWMCRYGFVKRGTMTVCNCPSACPIR